MFKQGPKYSWLNNRRLGGDENHKLPNPKKTKVASSIMTYIGGGTLVDVGEKDERVSLLLVPGKCERVFKAFFGDWL